VELGPPLSGVKEFVAACHAANPQEPCAPPEAGEGFAIDNIIAAAVGAAASADPKAIRAALTHVKLQTMLPGGPVEFTETGENL
jgi:hypothetical protein